MRTADAETFPRMSGAKNRLAAGRVDPQIEAFIVAGPKVKQRAAGDAIDHHIDSKPAEVGYPLRRRCILICPVENHRAASELRPPVQGAVIVYVGIFQQNGLRLVELVVCVDRPGVLTGVFLIGYALARAFVELFRQPDAHLGFLAAGLTMGQWLSLPMLLGGLYLIWRARR